VTALEVIQYIRGFCFKYEEHPIMPGYEFEHIVLGDYNLRDGNIRYCLDDRADKWFAERIIDARCWSLSEEESVRRLKEYRQQATAFLEWLLAVPDEVRTDAEWLEHDEAIEIADLPDSLYEDKVTKLNPLAYWPLL